MVWGAMLVAVLAVAPDAAAPPPQRKRVAVLDLQYAGSGDRRAVEGLSALLASEVARRPGLAVVSGADLRALIGFERQKALVGCSDGACLAELSGTLGVAYLVSSEVSSVGSSWLLSLGLLDAGKGSSVSRLTRRASSIDGLVDEVSRAVDELLAPLGPAGAASRASRFDGAWEVALDCPPTESPAAKGYGYRFPAAVRERLLVGQHLGEGTPGSLRLEGVISSDGKARLTGRGRTAGAEYSLKHASPGTPFSFGVEARFEDARGSGRRLEGRSCTFTFVRR